MRNTIDDPVWFIVFRWGLEAPEKDQELLAQGKILAVEGTIQVFTPAQRDNFYVHENHSISFTK